MTIEHRRMRGIDIRVSEDGPASVTLQLIVPNVVDDYGSVWGARSLDKGLETRLPVLCWSHDWSDPLGAGHDWEGSDNGPMVNFRFDDFDAVPRAKQAHAQLRSKTIQDCSIGFSRVKDGTVEPTDRQKSDLPGIREYLAEAVAEETSLVIRGAVPGAKVLAVRSMTGTVGTVSEEFVVDLGRKVAAGDITMAEALIAVDLAAGGTPIEQETFDIAASQAEVAEAEQLLAEAVDVI